MTSLDPSCSAPVTSFADRPVDATPSPAIGNDRRAWRAPAAWARLLVVLALGLTVDLATKAWTFERVADEPVRLDRAVLLSDPEFFIPYHEPLAFLPLELLDLQLVINRGAVFGIAANQRLFFIAFTVSAIVVGILVFGRMTTARQRLAHVGIGLILAGGIGNLFDRIVFGVVRDFLHMLPGRHLPFDWRWPGGSPDLFPWVFNLADVMLLSGMAMLLIHMHRAPLRGEQPAPEADSPLPQPTAVDRS